MIRRSQYRCSFNSMARGTAYEMAIASSRQRMAELVESGKLCNLSFYRYENMGFVYVEEIVENESDAMIDMETVMPELYQYLKTWPREDGDVFFAPMIKVFYQYDPGNDLDAWEHERTTAVKTRIGRVAFAFPDKVPSYVMYHTALVNEGLLKGDKYAFISLHENLLFSYYEEPRNNVNIRGVDEESKVISEWLKTDPESHYDRVKAQGMNFLVIPCLFTVDRVDKDE